MTLRSQRLIDPDGCELDALGSAVGFTGHRVLEVGCGDGRLTRRYAGETRSVLALDPNEEAIRYARKHTPAELRGRVRFEVAGALELDEPPASVDLVFYSWSL